MGNLFDCLKKYFENTPKEVLDKDWEEIKRLNEIDPDAIEYCRSLREKFQLKGERKEI